MDSSHVPSCIDRMSLYSKELPLSQLRTREEAKKQQMIIYNRLRENNHEVPPYELQNYIGKGSYGRVYVARDTRPDGYGRVAVKILEVDAVDFQAHLTDRDQTAQDFLKELKTLQQIQSYNAPNVNKIYEVLEVYSQFWIISEYCPGGSVHTLMQATKNKVEERYLRPIARELAIGLDAVHKASVIHRDIKAANVMIHEEGRLQIIDFGVAGTLVNQADKRTTVIGTPHWMGPEVFKGKDGKDKGYGTKADTWAYGCTLWEMATGRPPRSDLEMKTLEFALRTRAAPKLRLQEGHSQELSDLIAFTLVKDPDKRPSMEQILEHPYLKETEQSYPTSSLKYFVREFQDWANQGGQRQSLFNPHGAAAATVAQDFEKQPEWRFSTIATTEMMDRLPFERDYQTVAGFGNDPYLSSHLHQAADMSSIQAQEDAFDLYDASEPNSPYLSNSETTPGGSPTLHGMTVKPSMNDQYQGQITDLGLNESKVSRGGRKLGRLFDTRNSEYVYPSLTSSQSDLPLRNSTNGSSASNSKDKVVDASEIGTSNSGNIALADPATLKAKRLKDKDRPPTMAWDFAMGGQMHSKNSSVDELKPFESQPQTLDMYQQSPAAYTPNEVNDYGSPGEEVFDETRPTGPTDYGYPGDGAYEDSYLGPPTSHYISAPTSVSHSSSASQTFSNEDIDVKNKARQTLDLDALMDIGGPSDEVQEYSYDTSSTTSGPRSPQYNFGMPDEMGDAAKARQTLDLDALMGDMNPIPAPPTTFSGSHSSHHSREKLADTAIPDPTPYPTIPTQPVTNNGHPIFGKWRAAPPAAEVMSGDADDEMVFSELMRMLEDHSHVLQGVEDHYAQLIARMDVEDKDVVEKNGVVDDG